jgi:hypothetical protein
MEFLFRSFNSSVLLWTLWDPEGLLSLLDASVRSFTILPSSVV